LKDNIKEEFIELVLEDVDWLRMAQETQNWLSYTVCDHDDKYVGFMKWGMLLTTSESINLSRILLHRVNWSTDNSELDLPPVLILNELFYTSAFQITYFTREHILYQLGV